MTASAGRLGRRDYARLAVVESGTAPGHPVGKHLDLVESAGCAADEARRYLFHCHVGCLEAHEILPETGGTLAAVVELLQAPYVVQDALVAGHGVNGAAGIPEVASADLAKP